MIDITFFKMQHVKLPKYRPF